LKPGQHVGPLPGNHNGTEIGANSDPNLAAAYNMQDDVSPENLPQIIHNTRDENSYTTSQPARRCDYASVNVSSVNNSPTRTK
jgi:hypothetical protein